MKNKPAQRKARSEPRFKRIILKFSGEFLRGEKGEIISVQSLGAIVAQVQIAHAAGIEVAIVNGGGNIVRGTDCQKMGIDRTTGDYMGMLATVENGLAIQNALEKATPRIETRVQSAIPMNQVAEPFILRRAMRHMEKGRVVIFVGGTGNPYFTTDTAAALRACEIRADAIFAAKANVDGVYTEDPKKNPNAQRYLTLNCVDVLKERHNVMDQTAFSMCMDNNIPILVYNINDPTALPRILEGDESVCTRVDNVVAKQLAPSKVHTLSPAQPVGTTVSAVA